MNAQNNQPEYPEKYYAQLLFFARSDVEWAKSRKAQPSTNSGQAKGHEKREALFVAFVFLNPCTIRLAHEKKEG
jgi:hypothetical protein